MLNLMARALEKGENIGDYKIGALYALGSQLEAIFYFCGHELASKLEVDKVEATEFSETIMTQIVGILKHVCEKYHLGVVADPKIEEKAVTFRLENCGSCRNFHGIQTTSNFCSFEAGLCAGLVEKITGGLHCFAQEIGGSCQANASCEFMVVIQ